MIPFLAWLESSMLGHAMRNSGVWTYGVVNLGHILGVATLFGAWEGGLTGIATENKKLAKFHHDIDAGRYLILIYARKHQGSIVRAMMRAKHPEAELEAIDRHFITPFSALRKRAHHRKRPAARPEGAL